MPQWRIRLPSWLKNVKFNYYRLHLCYFVVVILLSSIIMYGSGVNGNSDDEESRFNLSYIDALFLCCSALTNTGLNTINLGAITGFQQAVLFVLIPMGNVMVVSTSTIYVRKYWFKRKMNDFLRHSKAGRIVAEDIEREEGRAKRSSSSDEGSASSRIPRNHRMTAELRSRKAPRKQAVEHHVNEYGGFPFPWQSSAFRNVFHAPFQKIHRRPHDEPHTYLSFQPSLDARGRFHSLSEREREELGGVEYRALHLLGWLLPAYCLFWFLLALIILIPYSYYHPVATIIRTSQPGDLDPGWWATFTVMSSFCNCGMNILDQNMIGMRDYYLILILTGSLILVGNQLFPVFLRFTIWIINKTVPKDSEIHHTCAFLLHHPRRCFILLFPSINTWYLLAAQLGIDLVLWASFGILNIGLEAVQSLSSGMQTIVGLYESLGVRVGGLYAILISDTAPALQIMYLVGMYISAFPIILSLRQTNVYEERSLGIQNDNQDDEDNGNQGEQSYLSVHVRRQLAYDLWWLVLAVWLISIIERYQIVAGGDYFTIWTIIFEVVSAYGTVGLSLGVPYDNYSLSGTWHTLSKLILICVMLRGRHRGLPYAIDRAVLLPGEDLMEKMDQEVNMRGGWRSDKWKAQEERVRRQQEGRQVEDENDERDFRQYEQTRRKGKGVQDGPS